MLQNTMQYHANLDNMFVADDPCLPSPCQNNGTCVNEGLTGYKCLCEVGWLGTNCEIGKSGLAINQFIS